MNKKAKFKNYLVIFLILIGLILLFISIYLMMKAPDKKKTEEIEEEFVDNYVEKVYLNTISDKNTIDTKIDLQSIFVESDNKDFINNYAVFFNNKIIYEFNPSICYTVGHYESYLQERINGCINEQKIKCTPDKIHLSDCSENYCENYYRDLFGIDELKKYPLCEKFNPDNTKEMVDLNKTYIISQNLDSNDLNIIDTFNLDNILIDFTYLNNKYLYYNYIIQNDKNGVKQIDLINNVINPLKDNYLVLSYPYSNNEKIMLMNNLDNKYILSYYNDELNTLQDDVMKLNNTNIIVDKYTDHYYTYDNNNLYKNGGLIYDVNNNSNIIEFFSTRKYLYIIINKDNNLELLKLSKSNYALKEHIKLDFKDINNIKYVLNNTSGIPYFIFNNNTIYAFNEENKDFEKISECNNIIKVASYHNFIILLSKDNEENNLIIYNTITNQKQVIYNIVYYYLNNDKLYVVDDINNLELSYYDIM